MPIPPRPIPQPQRRHARPGFSVPQKSPSLLGAGAGTGAAKSHAHAHSASPARGGALNNLDWRAEVALLDAMPACSSHATPRGAITGTSAPAGVVLVDAAQQARVRALVAETERRREGREVRVDLEGLIQEGKGKREKKATTATTLGFDFIPNPTIVALPDISPEPLIAKPHGCGGGGAGSSTPLSATPGTPALIPSRARSAGSPSHSPLGAPNGDSVGVHQLGDASLDEDGDEELDEELDEWEHILPLQSISVRGPGVGREGEDEGDMILVGEMELEEDPTVGMAGVALGPGGKAGGKASERRLEGLSYAAALGLGRGR